MQRYLFLLENGEVHSEYAGTTYMSSEQFRTLKTFCGKKVVDRCHYISWLPTPTPEWVKKYLERGRATEYARIRDTCARYPESEFPGYEHKILETAMYYGVEKRYNEALRRYKSAQALNIALR